jgi:phosphotransferase system enzyme I (PtsP)
MASEPSGALLLLGMGVDCLSVSRGDLLRIKWVIRSFTRAKAAELAEAALGQETPDSVRELSETALEAAGLGGLVRLGQ